LISAAPAGYGNSIFDKTGVVAVQTCGENGLGAAQLDPTGKVIDRFDLHPGSDPTTLSADAPGTRVLVDEY
jgi:hypothetical protein